VNVVDSSGWLEYFAAGPNAGFFAPSIEDTSRLVVPSVALYEVFRRVLQQRGEGDALQAVALMQQGQVVELSASLALVAAALGHELRLPMADSIILATARSCQAVLWTQDRDFESVPGVRYVGARGVREARPRYRARNRKET
jgi:toxin FitB